MEPYRLDPRTRIGHVHLTVSDLGKSLEFYRDVLGFEVQEEWDGAVFLSAGGYHHHIGLNAWSSGNPRRPHEGQIGLYHFAILYPNRKEMAKALERVINAGYGIDGASDHGVSEAVYIHDPDGNGIELYRDKGKKHWPRDKKGRIAMVSEPLDVEELLKEAGEP